MIQNKNIVTLASALANVSVYANGSANWLTTPLPQLIKSS